MNVIDLIQQAQEAALMEEARRPRSEGPPRWRPKVKWLWNPAAMCPWCEGWVETRRVWALDEPGMKVLGVWDAKGKRIALSRVVHPHVFSHGGVCNGAADAPLMDALWTGLNPLSPASGTVEGWLGELGHRCENLGNMKRLGARWQEVTEAEVDGFYCEGCDGTYDEEDVRFCERYGVYYCDNCYPDRHNSCEDCGRDVCAHGGRREYLIEVKGSNGYERSVCQSCYEYDYFTCEGCDEAMHLDKHVQDGVCRECWDDGHSLCEGCDIEFENDDLTDGMCGDCYIAPDECRDCRTTVSDPENDLDAHQLCEVCRVPSLAELEELGQLRLEVGDERHQAGSCAGSGRGWISSRDGAVPGLAGCGEDCL